MREFLTNRDMSNKDVSVRSAAQALPGGEETDFILVSCAGAVAAASSGGEEPSASGAAMLSHKRRGEAALRLSGLGYTIVRPGPLLEEPGGYKALVFDQACILPTRFCEAWHDCALCCWYSLACC